MLLFRLLVATNVVVATLPMKPTPFQQGKIGTLSVPVLLHDDSFTSTSSPPLSLFTAYDDAQTTQYLYIQNLYANNTPPLVVAKTGETIPSSSNSEQFTGFTELGGSKNRILFLGEGSGTWGKQNKFMGIYTTTSTTNFTKYKIVDTNDRLATGERFKVLCCGRTVPDGSGNVIFGGASAYAGEGIEGIYIWKCKTKKIDTLVDNTIQILRRISGPSKVTVHGDVFFFASNPSIRLADGIYHLNIFSTNETKDLSPVILRGSRIPLGKDGLIRVFTAFGSPVSYSNSNGESMILFTASGSFDLLGVYSIRLIPNVKGSDNSNTSILNNNQKSRFEIITIINNLDSEGSSIPFGNFPTGPSVDNTGRIIFNVDTNNERTSGLYYTNHSNDSSKTNPPILIRNLYNPMELNVDIEYNSIENGCLVYYTNNGHIDQLWFTNVSHLNL